MSQGVFDQLYGRKATTDSFCRKGCRVLGSYQDWKPVSDLDLLWFPPFVHESLGILC
jgi:hypothetical protein